MKVSYSSYRFPNLQYSNRQERALFIVRQFSEFIGKSVLDVGSSEGDVERFLIQYGQKVEKYTSVDLNPKAHFVLNLDHDPLPFRKSSFETVICSEVLEHLEALHGVFQQIVEVSSRNIIISVPNGWFSLKRDLFRGDSSGKFYGIPPAKPEDRHRWFFNVSEAELFFVKNCGALRRVTFFPYFNQTNKAAKNVARMFLGRKRYLNLFCPFLWVLIEK